MDMKTRAALSAFRSTASRFNQLDTTGEDLRQVEQELVESKIGIEFWDERHDIESEVISYDPQMRGVPDNMVLYRAISQLGFTKLGDRWQLAIRTGIEWYEKADADDRWNTETQFAGFIEDSRLPIAQASRSLRVKAAASLTDFLDEFKRTVEKYSESSLNN
jgi:hypothetical protein